MAIPLCEHRQTKRQTSPFADGQVGHSPAQGGNPWVLPGQRLVLVAGCWGGDNCCWVLGKGVAACRRRGPGSSGQEGDQGMDQRGSLVHVSVPAGLCGIGAG